MVNMKQIISFIGARLEYFIRYNILREQRGQLDFINLSQNLNYNQYIYRQ